MDQANNQNLPAGDGTSPEAPVSGFDQSKEAFAAGADGFLDFTERSKQNMPAEGHEAMDRMALDVKQMEYDVLAAGKERQAALDILGKGGPSNPEEVVEMVLGLSYQDMRCQELREKYGQGWLGKYLGRFRAFMAGELDSHLIDGRGAKKDWAEKSALGQFCRKALISIFNKQNLYAAGAAIAIGVLTGGVGFAAAGIVVGGILGRGAAEAWESTRGEEKSARGTMLEAERAHWIRLQDLAAEYKNAPAEEKSAKLQILIDEFYRNSQSASVLAMTKAQEDLATTIAKWDKRRVFCQTAGGIAGGVLGFGINAFGTHSFSGIDMDYLHNIPMQEAFHNVHRINGIWHFAYKSGEAMSNPVLHNGGLWHAAGETAAKVYAAAAAKAAPTIAAFLLANLGRKKLDGKKIGTFYEGSFLDKNKEAILGGLSQPAPVDSTRQTSSTSAAPQRASNEGVMTREETLDDSQSNDYKFSRRAAELVLALVPKYKDLDGANEEERRAKFLNAAKKILQEYFAVHYRNKDKKDESDVDGETVLSLIKDILGKEFDVKKVAFVAPGESAKGRLTADSGGFHGINVPKGEGNNLFGDSINIDHHGQESSDDLSASMLMFRVLKSWGFYEKRNPEEISRLEKLVEFVTHFDNMTGPFRNMENFKKSHRTVLGLRRFMQARGLCNFFMKNKNPDYLRELTDQELNILRLKGKGRDRQGKEVDYGDKPADLEKQNNEALELLKNIPIIETPYGKVVIDEGAKLSKNAFAASDYNIHVQIFVDKKSKEPMGFKISNMPQGVELPDGQRIRTMWICNQKPTTTTLETIVAALKAPVAKAAA